MVRGTISNGYLFMFLFQEQFLYSNLYYPQIYFQPRSTNSLPHHRRQSRSRHRKTALSMYSSPQFIHRTAPYRSYHEPQPVYRSQLSPVSSQTSVCYENEPNASRMWGYESFSSRVVTNNCSSPAKKFQSNVHNMHLTNTKGNYLRHESDRNNNSGHLKREYEPKLGEYGNNIVKKEPIYDDIKSYESVESIPVTEKFPTIIEEFYGEV